MINVPKYLLSIKKLQTTKSTAKSINNDTKSLHVIMNISFQQHGDKTVDIHLNAQHKWFP